MTSRSSDNVVYFSATNDMTRTSWAVPPPGGAIFASFVLFTALSGLTAIAYMGSEWLSLSQGFGFPTDLAWVRAVFARGLTSGHGLSFNGAPPVAGVAAPSWVAALALFGTAYGNVVVTAKALGVLSVIGSAFLAWAIVIRLVEDWRFAFLAGLLVVTNPMLGAGALSGTEGPLAGVLVLALMYWQGVGWEGTRRQRVFTAIAAGLAALTRPELLLLVPLMLFDRWFVTALHPRPGRGWRFALRWSLPEAVGAGLVMLPYVLYNLWLGGLWQRPEVALRPLAPPAWTKAVVTTLWRGNPVLLPLAGLGVIVAAASAARPRAQYPSFLPLLVPAAILLLPGAVWRDIGPQAVAAAATYLMPVVVVLAVAGLMLPYRVLQSAMARAQGRAARLAFGGVLGLVLAGICGFSARGHAATWRHYGDQIKRVANLQMELGEWAGQHLPPDASVASREVGALGYFSGKRMLDLGGTIDGKGIGYLRQPGAFDSNLLAFMREAKPSHLAIRAGEIPDLAQRPDIITPVTTRTDVDRETQGTTTLTLYETMWKPASVKAVEGVETSERRGHHDQGHLRR